MYTVQLWSSTLLYSLAKDTSALPKAHGVVAVHTHQIKYITAIFTTVNYALINLYSLFISSPCPSIARFFI